MADWSGHNAVAVAAPHAAAVDAARSIVENGGNVDERVTGMSDEVFRLVEATVAELRDALDRGAISSVELVAAYLNRIGYYDRHGLRLNAVPVLNPMAFEEARASDARRARGELLSGLDGIPYTAKDSYKVAGLTVACGSPAFEHLVASEDAFTIGRLRDAGAICLGLTNMPPMAGGGMQRGVYGRAESPYNRNFLASAYGSGSSNGSGVATAASFAAFGLGEETWSSGRAPAALNGLVAYTPSRGVISMRGNWPLFVTMDVVVPHARTMADLLELLNVVVADDPESRGDFWRTQKHVELPKASAVRPADYLDLRDPDALRGKRLGVPRMYINGDDEAADPIRTRESVMRLWRAAKSDLEALGATIVEVDFPAVSNYERDRDGARSMVDRGLVPEGLVDVEMWPLVIWSWQDFLESNGDPSLSNLVDVDGPKIYPLPPGTLPDRFEDDPDMSELVEVAERDGVTPLDEIPLISQGLAGLEETRRIDFENWLDAQHLDAVVFPAIADVAPHDADYNPVSNDIAWRNGVRYANGNLVIRHLGIPTVTVPMGVMTDIGMPAGLTFARKAYEDNSLLAFGAAFEASGQRRTAPPSTPALPAEEFPYDAAAVGPASRQTGDVPAISLSATIGSQDDGGRVMVSVSVSTDAANVDLSVNGNPLPARRSGDRWTAAVHLDSQLHARLHSHWRGPYGSLITAVARSETGACAGAYTVIGGVV
jgi:amidase